MAAGVPGREVFRNFPASLIVLFYVLATVAMAISAWGFWLHIRKYRRGRPAARFGHLKARLLSAAGKIGRH